MKLGVKDIRDSSMYDCLSKREMRSSWFKATSTNRKGNANDCQTDDISLDTYKGKMRSAHFGEMLFGNLSP